MTGRHATPAAERFWAKVEKTEGCWPWRGALTGQGYGSFQPERGKPAKRAHRYAYELAVGPIPDGLFVCHHCDNRACVRPDHLFTGTHAENMQDAINKGRLRHPTPSTGSRRPRRVVEIPNARAQAAIDQLTDQLHAAQVELEKLRTAREHRRRAVPSQALIDLYRSALLKVDKATTMREVHGIVKATFEAAPRTGR